MSEIQSKVLNWIATGRVGASSKAMAMTACGLPSDRSYPSDPDDLNRCLLLLEAVPEVREHFEKIAALGVVWGRLIGRWPDIEACFLDEVGLNWSKAKSAPKTYALMKEVMGEEPGVVSLGNGVKIKFGA
ncbi:hypothetical protein [Bowmanella yangjiangensis]|uniref:Uncharacterized protein n=1 Tax=Bowmanella yangjiangensis TaxID=2811230 RepID=A0ABS3CZP8_9ALTE|nr:hypothetical protein [Bowmanella yangjiangensis]MBN7822591.1 hypothetical protein [Bowmanella yangjiangensis]